MQMQNQLKNKKRMKKSHALILGSLLVFLGCISLSWNYLLRMRDEVFSDMKISMMDTEFIPVQNNENEIIQSEVIPESYTEEYVVDYSKYYGVIEIPKIGLKRGFYNVGSKYNNIQYNVTLVEGSIPPTDGIGNMVLMAHSGDAYISYFAYLYRLNVGDDCYITMNGNQYHYRIVDIHNVGKTGLLMLDWNRSKMTLTLITCTKDSDTEQTIYIAEYVE